MKTLCCVLFAVMAMSLGFAAQSTAATVQDVAGTYDVKFHKKFKVKGLGKEIWTDSDPLILNTDGTFTLGAVIQSLLDSMKCGYQLNKREFLAAHQ